MYEYEFRHGSYYLVKSGQDVNCVSQQKDIILMCDEVAICFCEQDWRILKHGNPDAVSAWHEKQVSLLIQIGDAEQANSLTVIIGKFPVEEINKCLTHSGYIQHYYTALRASVLETVAPSQPDTPFEP